jgi:competence protein ComEC
MADIVVAPFRVGKGCKARVVVDRQALNTQGAHALYFDGQSIRKESVAERRGRRPWVRNWEDEKQLPPGQAYARDQGNAEDDSDPRFDGNPDE